MATFRLKISGLMALVTDSASECGRLGIVVIDTTVPPRLQDGFLHEDLVAHEPVLKYRARQRAGAGDTALLGDQWGDLPFRRYRLRFEFEPSPPSGLKPSLPGVPKVADALPGAHMAQEVLRGDASIVFGQLALETGRIFSSPRTKKWSFKRSEAEPAGRELELSVESIWEVEGIDRVTVRAEPLPGGSGWKDLTLSADGDAAIEVELTNLCPTPPELPADWRRFKDDDFRWHYELLEAGAKTALRKELDSGRPAPLPFPLENPAAGETEVGRRPMASNNSCFLCSFGEEPLDW